MKILLAIVGGLVALYVVLWLTRNEWSEPLSTRIANYAHDAIHDPSPSQPSFLKDFGVKTAKKLLQLEIRSF